jgi:hypothetical protein
MLLGPRFIGLLHLLLHARTSCFSFWLNLRRHLSKTKKVRQTSGYSWPSDTVKFPGFFKPRETHTKAQSSFFFNLLFLKSPPWKHTRTVEIRESGSAGLGPVGLLWRTRAPSRTDGRSEFIDRLTQFLLVFLSLGQSKSGSPRVPGRARSAGLAHPSFVILEECRAG